MAIAGVLGRCFDRNKYPRTSKADIVNALGRANGYERYLEVATRTTGHRFSQVSNAVFPIRQRALYNCPADYADDLELHYSSPERNGEQCLKEIVGTGQTFDVVFIDPYHSYEASKIDLAYGLRLLSSGGVLVVHDCNPPKQGLTSPEYQQGDWMGETYLAFLEFVREHADLEYCVVDTDWGVGLIWRAAGTKPKCSGGLPDRPDASEFDVEDWKAFDDSRERILRLISVNQFSRSFAR